MFIRHLGFCLVVPLLLLHEYVHCGTTARRRGVFSVPVAHAYQVDAYMDFAIIDAPNPTNMAFPEIANDTTPPSLVRLRWIGICFGEVF
jgi:hypothetical protein